MKTEEHNEFNFFNDFDMQRICIDRCQFMVYDKKYSMIEHHFDKGLAEFELCMKMKRSSVGKRYEQVAGFESEGGIIKYEMRFRGPRSMLVRVNIIRLYNKNNDIDLGSNIINEDNFYPVDLIVSLEDQIDLLYNVIQTAEEYYSSFVKKYWDYECKDVKSKLAVVEFPYEVYPANIYEFAEKLMLSGREYRQYKSQSGTIYLDEKDNNIEKNVLEEHQDMIVSVNRIRTELGKIQFKIYQKSWGIVRMEHTVYGNDLKYLFSLRKNFRSRDAENIINFLRVEFGKRDLLPSRYTRDYEEALVRLAQIYKLSPVVIDSLTKMSIWESNKENRAMTQKLLRRGLIKKLSKGSYEIDKYLIEHLKSYPKRDVLEPTFFTSNL